MSTEIISREDAAAKGLMHFFTGRPCRYGHAASRFVSTGGCTACNTARAGRFRKDAPHRFSYDLHPQDVAAALAYCQALDLQRGRVPVGIGQAHAPLIPAPTSGPVELPEWMVQKRLELTRATRQKVIDDGAPKIGEPYLPRP